MGKIIFLCMLFSIGVVAGNITIDDKQQVQEKCLQCHNQEQIPNGLIYRRYLMKYSTKEAMKIAIMKYLKDPKQKNSIMPHPFFSKFSMKEVSDLDDENLKKNIQTFLNTFDLKKNLVLPE
ncbi:MAG: hypothetical protein DRG09_04630 [Epsilonproteobacteria bacterium]|nr:MAG: hypothetical protein DRG09_04630 [Campylobacterota bacterium]